MNGEKHLLIIGINNYEGIHFGSLENPVKDAQDVTRILSEVYGFTKIIELFNQDATRSKIINALVNLSVICHSEDEIIIYYAGHGAINQLNNSTCWIPSEGEKDVSNYIYDFELSGYIDQIQAKHIFVISDSCFSGQLFANAKSPITFSDFEDMEKRKSRWVFASGRGKVSDGEKDSGSPFCNSLCRFLDENKNQDFSMLRLCEHVTNEVKKEKPTQKAIWRPFGTGMPEQGQMIFRGTGGSALVISTEGGPKPVFDLPNQPLPAYYVRRTLTTVEAPTRSIGRLPDQTDRSTTLLELIATQKRIVILGTAGSGKSVELIKLGQHLQNHSPLVPYFKRLNTYTNEDFVSVLPASVNNLPGSQLVLLLDGLDEIQSDHFTTALKKIATYAQAMPDVTIVITCRSNFFDVPIDSFSNILPGFLVFQLNDLTPANIIRHTDEHYNANGNAFVHEAYEMGLLDHIQKPFFLDTAIKFFKKFGNLRTRRSALMTETMDEYFTENKLHFGGTGKLSSRLLTFQMLEKIGFVMEVMGRNYITDLELTTLFPNPSEYDFCQYLPAFRRDPAKEHWMFEHNNIQEFLASRVLEKEPHEKLLGFVTHSIGGETKIRPTWVNTLSFLISSAEESVVTPLVAWIQENDPEVLVRFEPGRLDEQTRITSFKKIFAYYDTRQIWISSNKFSDKELAAFGNYPACLDFLVSQLESADTSRMTRLNALHVLDNYDLRTYPAETTRIRPALFKMLDELEKQKPDAYGIQTVLKAFANLGINDAGTVQQLVDRYRKRLNQHVRAGLYRLLYTSEALHEHVDVLLEGMNLDQIEEPIKDRKSFSLMDESFHLTEALQRLNRSKEIGMVFDFLSANNHRNVLYQSDFREVIEALVNNAVELYRTDTSILEIVTGFLKHAVNIYSTDTKWLLLVFFEKTETVYQTFTTLWQETAGKNLWERSQYVEIFLSKDLVDRFITDISNGLFTANDLISLYEALLFNRNSVADANTLLASVEEFAAANAIALPEKPTLRDHASEEATRTREAFNLLFDRASLVKEMERIFHSYQKDLLEREDLFRLRSGKYSGTGPQFNLSAIELLRELSMQHNGMSLANLADFVADEAHLTEAIVMEAYSLLKDHTRKTLDPSASQKAVIGQWCRDLPLNPTYLWFFIELVNPELPEKIFLELTSHYNYTAQAKIGDPGIIDELEKFVDNKAIRKRVIENLQAGLSDEIAWAGNASYALRKGITEIFETILSQLSSGRLRSYKLHELLTFWYDVTEDHQRIAVFVTETVNEYLRWHAIELLVDRKVQKKFLLIYLTTVMNDESMDKELRFKAANHLVTLGDLSGFYFQAAQVLANPNPKDEFQSIFRTARQITDQAAIESLIKLLYLSMQPGFREDKFNSLDRPVYDALYSIGIASEPNFLAIKKVLQQFIVDHRSEFENIQFLEYHIKTMEEKLAMMQTTNLTIHMAIKEYQKLGQ